MFKCDASPLGQISCQFLPPGGSMGPRYVLQLLFCENFAKVSLTQLPLKLEKKKEHRFGILRILEIFWCMCDQI
jgi:hypothetical protein